MSTLVSVVHKTDEHPVPTDEDSGDSIGQIKKVAAISILDFDDPQVGVESEFLAKAVFGAGRIDPLFVMQTTPQAISGRHRHIGLRRGPEHRDAPVEPVDLDEDGARLSRAATAQNRAGAYRITSPQIGRDPEVGPQPHRLLDRDARLRRQFALRLRAEFAGDRQVAIALESLDRLPRRAAHHAVGLYRIT